MRRLVAWLPPLLLAGSAGGQCTLLEQAELVSSNLAHDEGFGGAVALDGDRLAVGAWHDRTLGVESGAVYVFGRGPGGTWAEEAKLVPEDGADGDLFGYDVDLEGATLVVGSPWSDPVGQQSGSAYVYAGDGSGGWSLVTELLASNAGPDSNFGHAVALSGDRIAVGAPYEDSVLFDSGAVYVFERNHGGHGAWGQTARLLAADLSAQDLFGYRIDLEGDRLAASAYFGPPSGTAYVFERDLGLPLAWIEVAKLVASDPSLTDLFGSGIALAGDRVLVGAGGHDHQGIVNAGAAYLYERDQGGPGAWGQVAELLPAVPVTQGFVGRSVALLGELALVESDDGNPTPFYGRGGALVFHRDHGGPGVWGELATLAASDGVPGDGLGISMACDGGTIALGAFHDHPEPAGADGGAVYLYDDPAPHAALAYCTAGTSASGCTAHLAGCGAPSASASSGFVVSAAGVEGAKDGLFFFGTSGRQSNPWGNGTSFQCVVPPVARGGLLTGTGTAGACDGSFSQDLNARWCPACPKPAQNPGAGATLNLQLWYRDPLDTSNQTTSLSDALEVLVGP